MNKINILKLLLNNIDIRINEVSSRGSALHLATKLGHINIMHLLLENKADPLI